MRCCSEASWRPWIIMNLFPLVSLRFVIYRMLIRWRVGSYQLRRDLAAVCFRISGNNRASIHCRCSCCAFWEFRLCCLSYCLLYRNSFWVHSRRFGASVGGGLAVLILSTLQVPVGRRRAWCWVTGLHINRHVLILLVEHVVVENIIIASLFFEKISISLSVQLRGIHSSKIALALVL